MAKSNLERCCSKLVGKVRRMSGDLAQRDTAIQRLQRENQKLAAGGAPQGGLTWFRQEKTA